MQICPIFAGPVTYVLATGNVPEMSCVLATGNVPKILCYTVPGNVKEMSKLPGVGNVHIINRTCELSCTFYGISWPRKFRISSSVNPSVKSLFGYKWYAALI